MRWSSHLTRFGILCGTLCLAASCTGSVSFSFGSSARAVDSAVEIIEGEEMTTLLGLGPISGATCVEPPNTDVGTTFDCEAMVDEGVLEFEVEVEEGDRIFARPQNVMSQDALLDIERSAAKALTDAGGQPVLAEALDCGGVVLISKPLTLNCDFTDLSTGDLYDATIDIPDIDAPSFTVRVADTPRE